MSTLESDLPTTPDESEFDLEVLAARRRRRLPLVTTALAVAIVAAGAFIGGVEIQKHYGGTTASGTGATAASALASRFRNATGGTGASGGGFFGAAGGATVGTVTLIKGQTLYVNDASGNTVKVAASSGSRITKTVSSTLTFGAIHPGDTVVVRGTQQKDGTVTADSITLGALTGGFGGATGFGGGARGSGAGGGATGFGGGNGG